MTLFRLLMPGGLETLSHHLSQGTISLILLFLGLVFTFFCLFHAFATKQGIPWILVLILTGVFGAIFYLFLVILRNTSPTIPGNPEHTIESVAQRATELKQELLKSDTVAHRIELGKYLLALGEFAEAAKTLEGCLKGFFKDDPAVLYDLAKAYVGQQKFQKAFEALEKTFQGNFTQHLTQRLALRGILHMELGRDQEALADFERISSQINAPEIYCRQAILYLQQGKKEKANAYFLVAVRCGLEMSPEEFEVEKFWVIQADRYLKNKAQV